MDKLLFSEGGYPLHIEDLEFLQSSLASPMQYLLSSWGNCILGGCEITLNQETSAYESSAGYISFGGQIYRAQVQHFDQIDQANTWYWIFSSAHVSPKVYGDGQEHPTRTTYTARLVSARLAPEGGLYAADSDLPRLGIDIARRTRLRPISAELEIVSYTELSPYSGVLTIRIPPTGLPLSGSMGSISMGAEVSRVSGLALLPSPGAADSSSIAINIIDGVFYARWAASSGSPGSHVRSLAGHCVSMMIYWDYGRPSSSTSPSSPSPAPGRYDAPPRRK